MSNNESNKVVAGPSDLPTWGEKAEFFRMRRWFRFLVMLVVFLWMGLIVWVLLFAPIDDAYSLPLQVSSDIQVILAPILIAGLIAEGLVGTFFFIIEGSWRTMVAYLGSGLTWLKNAEIEVREARQWFNNVSARYSQEMKAIELDSIESLADLTKELGPKLAAADELRQMAESRLTRAEENLSRLVAFDSYKSAKAVATIILGLMIGVIIAALMQLQMFALLGIGMVPSRMDVLITGAVIGVSIVPIRAILANLGGLVNRVGSKIL